MASIQTLAESWLQIDKDPTTRAEISTLLSTNNVTELELRLRGRIAFGTAGLRARMEAGFTRINCVTVLQASQGLAAYILTQEKETLSASSSSVSVRAQGIVIGHDARHNSEKYARLAAAAFIAKGFKVWWFARNVHTPLVPFAVCERGAAAGVMVTASHNPARDNGYKVYWSNGCQIIPPHDKGIAAAIERNLEPVSWDENLPLDDPEVVEDILDSTEAAYYERVKQLVDLPPDTALPRFVYTPMHGVGLPFLTNALRHVTSTSSGSASDIENPSSETESSNQPPFITVPSQAHPDPDFPTVRFPNPEEAGALDLAITTANAHSIPLIIATDPDADRLAVAEKLPSRQWHQYTGNQVGVLLASYVLDMYKDTHRQQREYSHENHDSPEDEEEKAKLCMLCSTVSSGMLRAMARAEGFHFVETLTGFKWLGNVAQQLSRPCPTPSPPQPNQSPKQRQKQTYHTPYAYEEALGYMFPSVVPDKDGISSALVFLSATSHWRKTSHPPLTPWGRLQQLYETYGYFADANTYLVSPSPGVTDDVFAGIRAIPPRALLGSGGGQGAEAKPPHPTHLTPDLEILRWRDLTVGYDSSTVDHIPELPVDPGSQMITCEVGTCEVGTACEDVAKAGEVKADVRFTIRASGTEPKIKLYVEARSAVSMDDARDRALRVREVLVEEWFRPGVWGLVYQGAGA